MKRLLLIEDDNTFAVLLIAYFQTAGYVVERVASARDGLHQLEAADWNAIIVDLTLPDEDGIVLIRMLRARSAVPIVVVTGRDDREDRLTVLEIGVDDFIVKPFEPRELLLRLDNILRREGRQTKARPTRIFCAGGELDLKGFTLLAPAGGVIELGATDFALLSFLARNQDRALTRAQIIDAIVGAEPPESERAIDIRISRLRRRLRQAGLDASRLRTVHGYGYKLTSGI